MRASFAGVHCYIALVSHRAASVSLRVTRLWNVAKRYGPARVLTSARVRHRLSVVPLRASSQLIDVETSCKQRVRQRVLQRLW